MHSRTRLVFVTLSDLLQRGLGALLLYSGLCKLQQPYDFLSAVYDYALVGPWLGLFIAGILPWLELVVGIALVTGIARLGALLLSSGMMCVFTFAKLSLLWRARGIGCSCFGATQTGEITIVDVCATALLLLLAISALSLHLRHRCASAPSILPE